MAQKCRGWAGRCRESPRPAHMGVNPTPHHRQVQYIQEIGHLLNIMKRLGTVLRVQIPEKMRWKMKWAWNRGAARTDEGCVEVIEGWALSTNLLVATPTLIQHCQHFAWTCYLPSTSHLALHFLFATRRQAFLECGLHSLSFHGI